MVPRGPRDVVSGSGPAASPGDGSSAPGTSAGTSMEPGASGSPGARGTTVAGADGRPATLAELAGLVGQRVRVGGTVVRVTVGGGAAASEVRLRDATADGTLRLGPRRGGDGGAAPRGRGRQRDRRSRWRVRRHGAAARHGPGRPPAGPRVGSTRPATPGPDPTGAGPGASGPAVDQGPAAGAANVPSTGAGSVGLVAAGVLGLLGITLLGVGAWPCFDASASRSWSLRAARRLRRPPTPDAAPQRRHLPAPAPSVSRAWAKHESLVSASCLTLA